MRAKRVGIVLGLALVLVGGAALPAHADTFEHSFTVAATQVLVNRYGGITVSGIIDCSAAVSDIYGSSVPNDLSIYFGKNWRATQYVGRGRAINAEWNSGIATDCSAPTFTAAWGTQYAFPSGATQWVYSSQGKFQAGAIHIEVWSDSEIQVGADTWLLAGWSGADLRAVKVR